MQKEQFLRHAENYYFDFKCIHTDKLEKQYNDHYFCVTSLLAMRQTFNN